MPACLFQAGCLKKTTGNFCNKKSFHSFAPAMNENSASTRIIRAAHELMLRYGIRSVSMDDIALHLGMSKKTIYQTFRDKDQLVEEVVTEQLKLQESLCETDRKSSLDAVHEMVLSIDRISVILESMNPSVLFDLHKYHPSAYRIFYRHKNEFLFNLERQNIIRGIREGLYRENIHPEITARYRVESILIPFDPEFQKAAKASLIEIEQELLMHHLFGLVNAKGQKLALKYLMNKKQSK